MQELVAPNRELQDSNLIIGIGKRCASAILICSQGKGKASGKEA